MRRNGRPVDAALKLRALEIAERAGAAAASAQTGIPAGTIRAWRCRRPQSAPSAPAEAATSPRAAAALSSVGLDPAGDLAELERVEAELASLDADGRIARSVAAMEQQGGDRLAHRAERAWLVASQALEKAAEAVREGKATNARNLAVTVGVLTDKATQLEQLAKLADDRRARIDQEQGAVLAAVFEVFFEAVRLPFAEGSPAAKVFASVLRQAAAGEALVPSMADAERARAEIRRRLRDEIREECRAELEAERAAAAVRDVLALPAAGDSADLESVAMAPPIRVVRTTTPVRGEVVDDPGPAWRHRMPLRTARPRA